MKTFILLLCATFCFTLVIAKPVQSINDSLNYELQRTQVNKLLNERSRKFGEFTASLEKKTGVFGMFKTKKDQQKSMDILKTIVLTDNQIFLETKRLLELKDFERERFKLMATEYDDQVSHYMKTITKLQEENEGLRTQIDHLKNEDQSSGLYIFFGLFSIIALLAIIIVLYKKLQQQKVT